MAKPKGINQKAKWRAHSIRLARYADRVQSVYDTLNKEIASAVVRTSYDGSVPFRFADYPLTKKKIEEVQAAFVRDLRSLIYSGTSEEWKQSNLVQDLLADKVLKFYGAKERGKKHRVYYQTNSDALKAFQQRKEDGMGLSERLWNQSRNYKEEMEYAISSAIEKGTSAVKLSKRLSKYLVDFPSLKHDYKDKFGKAVTCQDCEYRSIRLARSEINMAYRKAEQERWKQFDFVLGYEVKLTQNGHHVPDICDDLAGKYPKDFIFLGWHPNCMCYVVPILKTEEQFWNYEDAEPVTEPPKGFNDWLRENAERIDKAAENGTLPYWYTDNEKYVRMAEQYVDYPQFHTCKTREEYAQLAETLPFVRSVRYEDCSLPASEKITKTLFDLGKEFELPMENGGLDVFTWFEYVKGEGRTGTLGSFDMYGKQRLGIAGNADRIISRNAVSQKRKMLKRQQETIAQMEANLEAKRAQIEEFSWMGDDDKWLMEQKEILRKMEDYHKQLISDLAEKEEGFVPVRDTTARKLEDVVTHEFGHFINDNIRRNWDLYSEDVHEAVIKIEQAYGYKASRPRYIWEHDGHFLDSVAFTEGRAISFYASTEGCEYFAEAFVCFMQTGTSKNPLLDDLFNALKKRR